jgi:hypothetical protein
MKSPSKRPRRRRLSRRPSLNNLRPKHGPKTLFTTMSPKTGIMSKMKRMSTKQARGLLMG